MHTLKKELILPKLIAQLEGELQVLKQASQAAMEAATHEENRAENQYDTRGLEASYLAGAQLQRVQELEMSLGGLKQILEKKIPSESTIHIGSLIELEAENKKSWLYLLPFAAGTILKMETAFITVVSTQSPMGRELISKKAGDSFSLKTAGKEKDYEILQVH